MFKVINMLFDSCMLHSAMVNNNYYLNASTILKVNTIIIIVINTSMKIINRLIKNLCTKKRKKG